MKHHAIERGIDRRVRVYLADCTCGWAVRVPLRSEMEAALESHVQEATVKLPCGLCGAVGDAADPLRVEVSRGGVTRVWVCRSCGRVVVEVPGDFFPDWWE